MKVNGKDLARAVKMLRPCLSKRHSLDHVHVIADGGEATLTATDMDMRLSLRIPCEGRAATRLYPLSSLSAAESQGEVEILSDAVVVEGIRLPVETRSADEWPRGPEAADYLAHPPAPDLLAALRSVAFAARPDRLPRESIMGVCLHGDGKRLHLAATDTSRLAVHQLGGCPRKVRDVIPTSSVKVLTQVLSGRKGIAQIATWDKGCIVSGEDFIFSSRWLEGRFPQYERIIERPLAARLDIPSKSEFRRVLNIIRKIRDDSEWGVLLLPGDHLRLRRGDHETVMDIDGSRIIASRFNAAYLIDAIDHCPEPVSIRFGGPRSPAYFTSGEWTHLLMPLTRGAPTHDCAECWGEITPREGEVVTSEFCSHECEARTVARLGAEWDRPI